MTQLWWNFSLLAIAAYVIGSLPSGYWLGLLKGVNIRRVGSGNTGATNTFRVLGAKWGITVMLLDILKALFAVLLAKHYLDNHYLWAIIGLITICGNVFSVFLKFKGGKAVATSTGVLIGLTPLSFLFALSVFILALAISRYVSLGSLLGAATIFIAELVINLRQGFPTPENVVVTFFVAAVIIARHRSNIKRLLAGTENKIQFKR